jgi:hypothetical protein
VLLTGQGWEADVTLDGASLKAILVDAWWCYASGAFVAAIYFSFTGGGRSDPTVLKAVIWPAVVAVRL